MKVLCYLLGFGMLVFALLYADSCSRLRDSQLTAQAVRSVWEADKAIVDKEISLRDSFLLAEENDREKASAQHAKKQSSLLGQINSLKSKLREKPIPFVIQDTIIFLQDSLIADLRNERDSLKISFETSIDSLKATVSTQNGQISLCDSLIKEIRIPTQPSKLAFGLSAGYGLMSTGGEVRAGVFMGPSLTYRIPIKINLRKIFRKR